MQHDRKRSFKSRGLSRYLRAEFALMLVAVFFWPAARLFAQATGSIQGTIVDPTGAAVPGASVQVIDQAKGDLIRQTTSDADGVFRALPLAPGTYALRITAPGMKELNRKGVVLDANQSLGLGQITLTVGSTTESVTVTTQAPLVELATSDHSAVIDSREVTEQSLNGRDFQSLMRTLPGVVSNDMSDFRLAFNNTDSFHVNGMRGSDNNVFLDGTINTDVGANDGQYTQLSMDAVNEFKLQTGNFAAEYGRNPGVLIAMTTKSGGKQFHGTLYEFNRNTDFDANDWFTNHAGNPRPTLHFNQFGGNIGGYIPIPKISPMDNKKLFFFFNYEGTRASRPNGGTYYDMPNPVMLGIGTPNGEADLSPGQYVRFQWRLHVRAHYGYQWKSRKEWTGIHAGNSQIRSSRRDYDRHPVSEQSDSSGAIQRQLCGAHQDDYTRIQGKL